MQGNNSQSLVFLFLFIALNCQFVIKNEIILLFIKILFISLAITAFVIFLSLTRKKSDSAKTDLDSRAKLRRTLIIIMPICIGIVIAVSVLLILYLHTMPQNGSDFKKKQSSIACGLFGVR